LLDEGLASEASEDVIASIPVPKAKSKTKTKAKPKAKTKAKTKTGTRPKSPSPPARSSQRPAYRLRRSPVHGTGSFAIRTIAKGETIVEYVGERISHEEADRRHADKADDDNHTFLFTIDAKTVIDGGVRGNDARFLNHSCDPNCEVVNDDGRLFVEAVRTIQPGDELTYDYNLTRAAEDTAAIERIFACVCGAASCRGTMLAPQKKPRSKASKTSAGKDRSSRR
jgi:SET domain-containing protein